MSPKTPSDGHTRIMYRSPWWKRAWHSWRDRREQKAFTRRHRAQEHTGGFRLANLNDGHLTGFRPWCDTKLRPCPDFPWRLCCPCSHSEVRGG